MGKYRQSEATVMFCKRQELMIYTAIDIEPFDNKSVLSSYPRAPASLILLDEGKTIWHFDLHKALSIEEKKISFVSYIASSDLPIVGQRYIFSVGGDQINLRQLKVMLLIGNERSLFLLTRDGIMSIA